MGICLILSMRNKRNRAGRPLHCRWVEHEPNVTLFKPQGRPVDSLEQINLTIDELEAIRLADLEELYQEKAAEKMNISRQTFGRIISSAHKKVADALINGKAIFIGGGEFMPLKKSQRMGAGGFCFCPKCKTKIPHQQGIPCQEERCPKCDSKMMREDSYHHDLLKQKQNQKEK